MLFTSDHCLAALAVSIAQEVNPSHRKREPPKKTRAASDKSSPLLQNPAPHSEREPCKIRGIVEKFSRSEPKPLTILV